MIIQRKRVAKRLASGLVAGALALGGLAMSGAWSPAGAVPVELGRNQRLGGSDRFETSALIAEQLDELVGVSDVIVANGDNFPDALAASALAGSEAPILLVKANSIPQIIANRMSRLANDTSTVTVIGGTSAVSADVFAQIEAIFDDSVVTRIAGDDRYDTALQIADEVGLDSETVIIASGASYADAVSVGGYAADRGTPILLSGPSGLNADTLDWIGDAVADEDLSRVLIIGGPAAVNSAVEQQLVTAGVAPAGVSRIAGPSRYITNLLWNMEEFGYPLAKHLSYDVVAPGSAESRDLAAVAAILVSGENFPDALSAGPLAAQLGAHIILTDASATGGFTWTTLAGAAKMALTLDSAAVSGVTSALTDNALKGQATFAFQDLWVIGGTNAVPNSVVDAGTAAADDTVTCTVSVDGANDLEAGNQTSIAVEFSTNLQRGLSIAGVGDLEDFLGIADVIFDERDYIEDNVETLFDADGVDLTVDAWDDSNLDGFEDTLYLTASDPLEEGADISFDGIEADSEDYGSEIDTALGADTGTYAMGLRNFAPCETSVARDRTAPTATVVAVNNGDDQLYYVTMSELIDGNLEALLEADLSNPAATSIACSDGGSETRAFCTVAGVNDTEITLSDATYYDFAGNDLAEKDYDVEDELTNPTITASSQCVKMGSGGFKDGVWTGVFGATANAGDEAGDITIELTTGDLVLSADSGQALLGANGYSFTINSVRGTLLPSISVDGSDVTITIDQGYHTGADVARLINSSAIGAGGLSPLWVAEGDADGLVPVTSLGDSFTTENAGTEATQSCLITVNLSSPMLEADVEAGLGTVKPTDVADLRISIGGVVQDTASVTMRSPAGGGNRFYVVVNNTSDTGAVRVEMVTQDLSETGDGSYRSVTAS